jgi:hypothetical protein
MFVILGDSIAARVEFLESYLRTGHHVGGLIRIIGQSLQRAFLLLQGILIHLH